MPWFTISCLPLPRPPTGFASYGAVASGKGAEVKNWYLCMFFLKQGRYRAFYWHVALWSIGFLRFKAGIKEIELM